MPRTYRSEEYTAASGEPQRPERDFNMELMEMIYGGGYRGKSFGKEGSKRKAEMYSDKNAPLLGSQMGGSRRATRRDRATNYREAEKRLNDMLYMTGGYINPQRNMGDLYKKFHGFI